MAPPAAAGVSSRYRWTAGCCLWTPRMPTPPARPCIGNPQPAWSLPTGLSMPTQVPPEGGQLAAACGSQGHGVADLSWSTCTSSCQGKNALSVLSPHLPHRHCHHRRLEWTALAGCRPYTPRRRRCRPSLGAPVTALAAKLLASLLCRFSLLRRCLQPVKKWLPPVNPKDTDAEGLPLEHLYRQLSWDKCSVIIGLENKVHFCQWVSARLGPIR